MSSDVVIVGAGIAGLSCAAVLAEAGRRPIVVEKSRGVGGRCATRRVQGQAVDHGVAFLHGSDPEFLVAASNVAGAGVLEGWPTRVAGNGAPCQPDALSAHESRLAYAQGISAFPKDLARGLDVRLEARVTGIDEAAGGFVVAIDGQPPLRTRDVVLALPAEQARAILGPLSAASREAASGHALLEMAGSLPCLTLLSGYPAASPDPGWHVSYPEDSGILQLVANDSSKRVEPSQRVLVFQARPRWSRANLEEPAESWSAAILAEAGRLVGGWAARPAWSAPHRWLYARIDRGSEFREPLLLRWPGGRRLGLAGEIFSPGGGVQAAWRSGRTLALRLLREE